MLVEDFLHGQGDDDLVAAFEKRFDLLQRVRRIIERHEETFLAILAHHHGFKGVNVRAAGLVFLFDLVAAQTISNLSHRHSLVSERLRKKLSDFTRELLASGKDIVAGLRKDD